MSELTLFDSNDAREPALVALADEINDRHEACVKAAEDAVSHAIAVGRLLIDAKARVKHGEWSQWVSENCRFSHRMAQNYVAVAKNETRFVFEDARPTSLRQALAIVSDATTDQGEPRTPPRHRGWSNMSDRARHDLCRMFWDQRAGLTLLYDLAGWLPEDIAAFAGVDVAFVETVLPAVPVARFDSPENGLALLSDPDRDGPRLRAMYGEAVRESINARLANAWRIAEWRCRDQGEYPELLPAVTARRQRCERVADQISAKHPGSLWANPFEDPDLNLAAWFVILDDSARAVGMDADRPEGPFLDEFRHVYRMVLMRAIDEEDARE